MLEPTMLKGVFRVMKKYNLIVILALFVSSVSFATGLKQSMNQIITEIKTGQGVSLETVDLLTRLDQSAVRDKLGYALCRSGGNSNLNCPDDATLGYAMCRMVGNSHSNCPSDASIGYGVCRVAGNSNLNCNHNGSLGYGLCRSLGNSNSDCVD